jgi:hypothetical protein
MIFECHDSSQNSSLYIISGYSTSSVAPDIDEYLGGSGADLRTIVQQVQAVLGGASTSPGAGIVIGCNPDTSISRADLDFDDALNLTYTGGDFTTLSTINPDSLTGLQAIFPSHCTYAMDVSIAGTYPMPHAIAYDSAEGAWLYATKINGTGYESYLMFGAVLEPSADANEYGTVYVWGQITSTSGARCPHQYAEVSAFDPSGTRQVYDLSVSATLTSANYKVSGGADDGKLNWRRVDVINGTGGAGIKGTVKPHLMCEVGIYRDGTFYHRPITFGAGGEPVVCYTESCAFFWAEGVRLFPSYYVYNP